MSGMQQKEKRKNTSGSKQEENPKGNQQTNESRAKLPFFFQGEGRPEQCQCHRVGVIHKALAKQNIQHTHSVTTISILRFWAARSQWSAHSSLRSEVAPASPA